MTEATHLIVS